MKKLTTNNALVLNDGVSLLKFYADWCGPCRLMTPVVESLSDEFPKVAFYEVDVDVEKQLAAHFGVRSLPTIHLVVNGNSVHSWTGVVVKDTLKKALEVVTAPAK